MKSCKLTCEYVANLAATWYYKRKKEELKKMPNIKPVSDLRNYTDLLKEVDVSNRVYLTRNGHGVYGILTMAEIDELDRMKAAYSLFANLQKAEERAESEGWIDAEALELELGV